MKLLLKESLKNLGNAGEVVEVKDGYGRNYLVPYGKAVEVTEGNLQAIEQEKKRLQAAEGERVLSLKEIAERINGVDVTVTEKVSDGENLYGAVQAKTIVAALAEQGIVIEVDAVNVKAPIKTLGVHRVPIKLHSEVVAELKLWVVDENGNGATPARDEETVATEKAVAEATEE